MAVGSPTTTTHPSQLDVECVRQGADHGEEHHAGVEEPLVLLAAVADKPVLVGATNR